MKRLIGGLLLTALCVCGLKAATDQPVKKYTVDIATFTDTEAPTVKGQDIYSPLRLHRMYICNTATNTYAVTVYDGETKLFAVPAVQLTNLDIDFKGSPLNIKTGIRTAHTSTDNAEQQTVTYVYQKFLTAEGDQASRLYYQNLSSASVTAVSVPCLIEQIIVSSTTTGQTLQLRDGSGGNSLIQMYLPATVPVDRDYTKTPLYFPNGFAVISSAAQEGVHLIVKYKLAFGQGKWKIHTSTAVVAGANSTNLIGNIDIEVSDIYFESQSTAATQTIYDGSTKVLEVYQADDKNVHVAFDPYIVFTSSVGFYSSSATTPPKVNVIYRRN